MGQRDASPAGHNGPRGNALMETDREQRHVRWTRVIYGLHALSLVIGIVGVATVVGAFLTGWPSIIAVILNYLMRGEVEPVRNFVCGA